MRLWGVVALLCLGACASAPPAGGARQTISKLTISEKPSESKGSETTSKLTIPDPPPPEPPPSGVVSLAAVGDVMLARTIGARIEHASPFAGVASILRAADIAVANLECAAASPATGSPAKKAFTFKAPPASIPVLADAGIDVVSLANNHALDFGPDAFAETMRLLDASHVAYAGGGANEARAHAPAIVTVNGVRVAFLGYVKVMAEGKNGAGFDTRSWEARGDAPGVAWADPPRIASDVAAAKQSSDAVVVMLHSGFEAARIPNVWQRAAAHAAIDAGAALVLGAHPHVLQGVEKYKNGFIAYSLGNFVFDGPLTMSAILRVVFDKESIKSVEWTPVILRDGFPQIADEKNAELVRRTIDALSIELKYRYAER